MPRLPQPMIESLHDQIQGLSLIWQQDITPAYISQKDIQLEFALNELEDKATFLIDDIRRAVDLLTEPVKKSGPPS